MKPSSHRRSALALALLCTLLLGLPRLAAAAETEPVIADLSAVNAPAAASNATPANGNGSAAALPAGQQAAKPADARSQRVKPTPQFPNSPLIADPTKAPDQYGLRPAQIDSLRQSIIPGTGLQLFFDVP